MLCIRNADLTAKKASNEPLDVINDGSPSPFRNVSGLDLSYNPLRRRLRSPPVLGGRN